MDIRIQDFQMTEVVDGTTRTPINLNQALSLVQEYNAGAEKKIRVYHRPILPTYDWDENNGCLTISLNGFQLENQKRAIVEKLGYIIIDHNFFMVTETAKTQIQEIFSEDYETQTATIKKLTSAQLNPDRKLEIQSRLSENIKQVRFDPNVELIVQLYQYQQKGLIWLSEMYKEYAGALLADDMGLGKTAQVIAFIANGIQNGELRRTLIVVPNSLLANWQREIEKFTNGLKPYIHWGAFRAGFKQQLDDERIIITTYSTITNDLSLFQEFRFDLLVCDEASLIKNSDAARTQAINSLNFSFSILISGTPFENSVSDLWSLTHIIHKNFLGTEEEFKKKYASTPLQDLDNKQIQEIENKVSKLMLRRMKEDVLDDLPEKIDIHTALTQTPQEENVYNEIVQTIKNSSKHAALALIAHLRKFTSHPALYNNEILQTSFEKLANSSAKFKHLSRIIHEVCKKNEKALVFANHVDLLTAMQATFAEHFNIECFKIDGTVPINERQKIIDAFQSVSCSSILFLNPITAGMGLNITAANHVIHYSRQWNPALEAQATARAFRNGQDKNVNAYYLYYADTIEELIHNRINLKTDISGSLIQATSDNFDDEWYLEVLGGS